MKKPNFPAVTVQRYWEGQKHWKNMSGDIILVKSLFHVPFVEIATWASELLAIIWEGLTKSLVQEVVKLVGIKRTKWAEILENKIADVLWIYQLRNMNIPLLHGIINTYLICTFLARKVAPWHSFNCLQLSCLFERLREACRGRCVYAFFFA